MRRRCVAAIAGAMLLGLAAAAAAQNAPGTPALPSGESYGGGPSPVTVTVRPIPGETAAQILAHQDSRADFLRQGVAQLRTQFENDLAQLRTRMRSELVDRTVLPLYGIAVPISTITDDGACVLRNDPCPDCEKQRAAAFDKWFGEVTRMYDTVKSWQDADFTAWAEARAKKREDIAAKKLTRLEDGAEWQEREAKLYREIYALTMWQGLLVWGVQAAEAVGFRAVTIPSLKGVSTTPGKFPRGPTEFGGLLDVLDAEAEVALHPAHLKVAGAGCEAERAYRARAATPTIPMGPWNVADQKYMQAGQRLNQAILACRKEEDAQRDVYAPKFRPVRQRLRDAWPKMSGRLKTWRDSLIASHVYVGEGNEAIQSHYGNGHETALADGLVVLLDGNTPFLSHPYTGPMPFSTLGFALGNVTGSVPAGCWPREKPVSPSADGDDMPATIKYADLEVRPFSFGLGDFGKDAGRATEIESRGSYGVASGAGKKEAP